MPYKVARNEVLLDNFLCCALFSSFNNLKEDSKKHLIRVFGEKFVKIDIDMIDPKKTKSMAFDAFLFKKNLIFYRNIAELSIAEFTNKKGKMFLSFCGHSEEEHLKALSCFLNKTNQYFNNSYN